MPGHTPWARLPDGTPYSLLSARSPTTEMKDCVQCHLCGEWFRMIGGAHLTRRSERYRI
jgi:hypothetical protein